MSTRTIKHFINLTNGVEAIPTIPRGEVNFIRIQSTTLERKNWYKFFIDLDHNLLMWLALGAECRVYDFGARRNVSKTIFKGIPVLRYCLDKYWFGYEAEQVIVRTHNVKDYVEHEIYQRYFVYHDESLLQAKMGISGKFKYYRKYLNCNRVNLIGISHYTIHDSDVKYYKSILEGITQ